MKGLEAYVDQAYLLPLDALKKRLIHNAICFLIVMLYQTLKKKIEMGLKVIDSHTDFKFYEI